MLNGNKVTEDVIEDNNERMLYIISKLANSVVNKVGNNSPELVFSPKTTSELNKNTVMLNNIICLKLKNSLIRE